GAEVVSAILFGNQAVGGFRVENSAGDKVQIALNEPDPIQWTPEARAHYTITVGAQGDGRYLKGFHGAERSDRTFRWSSENAVFLLPSLPDKPALVTIELDVPRHALSDESGLYLADQRIAPLSNTNVLKVHVPASGSDRVQLRLRARGWIPSKVIAGSTDSRILGVRVFRVTVKTDGAGSRIFDANTGRFAGPDKS
ncbi:MAG: hypothetical protein N3G20_10565, partial [Verrucomicrobiae bacterium]|nr:hypothetical protein [Verrucomicrobiae bacterium]